MRSSLKLLTLATLCGTGLSILDKSVDVVVVGAGLSGLSAAKDLIAGGKSVFIIEARDRVGGRVLNVALPNGMPTEVGAEFVGPTQDRVLALASNLGLTTYKTYNTGKSVLYANGTTKTYSASGPLGNVPPVDGDSLIEAAKAQSMLDTMAASINVSAPWNNSNAVEWDSQTLSSWLDKMTPLEGARFLIDVATASIFSAEPRELSLLYTLAYIASAGNETTPGTLERLTNTADGAQESRIKGGTQMLAIKLADKLGRENIAFNAPVRRISALSTGYMVTADGYMVEAKQVVVAMSPPLAARIEYDPLLPAQRDQLCQRMPMGSIGKAIAVYDTPFWRDDGLNGQVVSDSGTVRVTFDSTPDNSSIGVMMGFIETDQMRRLDSASNEEIQREVMKDFVNYFGPKAAKVNSWVIQRWDNEQFSRGGPVAFGPPGVLTQYGRALTKPFNGIHFAGTESASYWTGYMDGAIRSGERAAKEILGVSPAEM